MDMYIPPGSEGRPSPDENVDKTGSKKVGSSGWTNVAKVAVGVTKALAKKAYDIGDLATYGAVGAVGTKIARTVVSGPAPANDNEDAELQAIKSELLLHNLDYCYDQLVPVALSSIETILSAQKDSGNTASANTTNAVLNDIKNKPHIVKKQIALVLAALLNSAPVYTTKQMNMREELAQLKSKIVTDKNRYTELGVRLKELNSDNSKGSPAETQAEFDRLQESLKNDQQSALLLKLRLERIAIGRVIASVSKLASLPNPGEDLTSWAKRTSEVLLKGIFPDGATDKDINAGIRSNIIKSFPHLARVPMLDHVLGLSSNQLLLQSVLEHMGAAYYKEQQAGIQVTDEFVDVQLRMGMGLTMYELTRSAGVPEEFQFAHALAARAAPPAAKTLLGEAVKLERDKKAAFDQQIGAVVLDAVADHLKIYNEVKNKGEANNPAALAQAVQKSDIMIAANADQEVDKFYKPHAQAIIQMLLPNGSGDLTFLPEELRALAFDGMKTVLPKQLPVVVDLCLVKFLSPRFAKELILKIMDNEVQRRRKKRPRKATKEPVVDHTSGKMNDAVGKLSEQVLGLLDLSTLPSLVKHYIQDKDGKIKPKYQKLVTEMLLEQFGGELLETTLQGQVDASKLPQFKLPFSEDQFNAARTRIDGDRSKPSTDKEWEKAIQIVQDGPFTTMTELELDSALTKALNSELSEEGLSEELAFASRSLIKAVAGDTISGAWESFQAVLDDYCATFTITEYAKIALDQVCRFVFITCIGTVLSFLFKNLLLRAMYSMMNLDVNHAILLEFLHLPAVDTGPDGLRQLSKEEQSNLILFHKNLLFRITNDLKATVERLSKQITSD